MTELRAELIEQITSATLTDDGNHLVMSALHNGNSIAIAFHTREILAFVAALTKALTLPDPPTVDGAVPLAIPPTAPVPSGLSCMDDTEKFDINSFQIAALV